MNNRTENGRILAGTDVVAADAIARLAGVDLKSVTKVLLAIEALAHCGYTLADLSNADALPTSAMSAMRFERAAAFVDSTIHALQKSKAGLSLLDQLSVHRRFGNQRKRVRSIHGALGQSLALVG